jgi:hypothetical protein
MGLTKRANPEQAAAAGCLHMPARIEHELLVRKSYWRLGPLGQGACTAADLGKEGKVMQIWEEGEIWK